MVSPTPTTTPTTTPNPPRYRWLRRGVIAALVFVAGLIPLRLYWGHREQGELDRVVEEARAMGYPVYFDDLQPASLPPSENRASYILQAAGAIPTVNALGQTLTDTDWYNEGGADYFEEHQLPDPVSDNAAYLVQFQPVLDALREARAHSRSDWTFGQPIPRPAMNMLLPHLGDSRMLARAVEDAIHRAMAEEDYLLAIAMLGDLITISDSLRGDPYSSMDHLIVISIRDLAADALQQVLAKFPNDPALSAALEALNSIWLDETWATSGLSQAYQAELWFEYEYVSGLIDGQYNLSATHVNTPDHLLPLEYSLTRRLLRPYYQSDLTFIVQYNTALIDAAEGCDNLQAFHERLVESFYQMDDQLVAASVHWPIEHPLATEIIWSYPSYRVNFRGLATSRMCATAIALKRYEIDHGNRPETLEALVPAYLDAVLDDPFVLDRQITYVPSGIQPTPDHGGFVSPLDPEVARRAAVAYPILYCVGDDGVDHGGLFPIDADDGGIENRFFGSDSSTDWCFILVETPKPIPNPNASPFHQGQGQSGPGLGTPPNPGGSPGDEEQVDESGDGGEGNENDQPPADPEQRED